jgi:hypothetical protein
VSPKRGFSFENLLNILREVGFELQSDHTRELSVQRTLKPSVLTEQLYVLTKPGEQRPQ